MSLASLARLARRFNDRHRLNEIMQCSYHRQERGAPDSLDSLDFRSGSLYSEEHLQQTVDKWL